jgi:magnesium chelatase family protein
MSLRFFSAAVLGVDAFEVQIEANAGWGRDGQISIVGLPDTAIKESRDRVTSAVKNSALRWPPGKVTINLAPADLRKEGPAFDLPIALATAGVIEHNRIPDLTDYSIAGELALSGQVRPIKGALAIALEAKRCGRSRLIVPAANAREAAIVGGVEVYSANSLAEVVAFLRGDQQLVPAEPAPFTRPEYDSDFSEVRGQFHVRRAVEIAAAAGHNLLMIGPPGSGKSMIAKRIPTILPPLALNEAIETTKIHSVCGLLAPGQEFMTERPFRSPHHTISDVGLLGGSGHPMPGEVSLAHHGVLFLDEIPEFRRSTLEVMRQPLEDGRVTISRAAGTMTFPSEFMLIAAMNPCPCGHYGDPRRDCRCTWPQIAKYRSRISGPLLDRIDIHIEVPAIELPELTNTAEGEPSAVMRKRVGQARWRQLKRFAAEPRVRSNARMTPRLLKQHCALDSDSQQIIRQAITELHLSARAYDRVLKVARTIADLAGAERIQSEHLAEAVQYRTLDRSLW